MKFPKRAAQGNSPAQMFFGSTFQGPLPSHPPSVSPTHNSRLRRSRKRTRPANGNLTTALRAAVTAAACLTAVQQPPVAGARTNPRSIGSTGDIRTCRRRGLEQYGTRGCFVLCVTPASAAGDRFSRDHRSRSCATTATSTVRRTRAGAIASRPPGGLFGRGGVEGHGDGSLADSGRSGAGAGLLACRAAKDGAEDGRVERSRFRRVFDKMRGYVPPPAKAANTLIYDTQVRYMCVVCEVNVNCFDVGGYGDAFPLFSTFLRQARRAG